MNAKAIPEVLNALLKKVNPATDGKPHGCFFYFC